MPVHGYQLPGLGQVAGGDSVVDRLGGGPVLAVLR